MIEQQFKRLKESDPSITRTRPRVVIDANLIGYSFISKGIGPVKAVYVVAEEFAKDGIDVSIVCDNKDRHHSKRATCLRKGERERAKIKVVYERAELSQLLRAPNSETPDIITRTKQLQRSVNTLENKVANVFPSSFIGNLQSIVNKHDAKENGSISLHIAPYQADPDIARRVIWKEADAIISGDSDFPMYIGTASCDLMVGSVKLDIGSLSLRSAKFVTGQDSVQKWIHQTLQSKITTDIFPSSPDGKNNKHTPSCPVFDAIDDPMCRAILAVALV